MDFLNGLIIGFMLGVFRKELVIALKALLEYIFNIKKMPSEIIKLTADDKK